MGFCWLVFVIFSIVLQDCILLLLICFLRDDSFRISFSVLFLQNGNADMVQMLAVFGSNVNASNSANISPRHLAAVSSLKDK